jgi:hypothetical protein
MHEKLTLGGGLGKIAVRWSFVLYKVEVTIKVKITALHKMCLSLVGTSCVDRMIDSYFILTISSRSDCRSYPDAVFRNHRWAVIHIFA